MATRTSTYTADRSDAAPYISEATPGSRQVFPQAHPWRWIGAFICAVLIYFIVLSAAGSFING